MLNLIELEQFVAFADLGTLSAAAEKLHISQPTLTRSMRHVEEAFGVALFERGKNRIALNETGKAAVGYARGILKEAETAVVMVQQFDEKLHTITVESCAPAPLWTLVPELSSRHPENAISSKFVPIPDMIEDVKSGQCDIGVLPYACEDPSVVDIPYVREQLSVGVPYHHALAEYDTLTFAQINGFNCLLRDKIGFWSELCYEKMPASKFLVQTEMFALEELIRTSTLLCFVTNFVDTPSGMFDGRKIIPLTDPEADVTYHLICLPEKEELVRKVACNQKNTCISKNTYNQKNVCIFTKM